MSAIHLVVRPQQHPSAPAGSGRLYGLFDVVVDGVNVTARIGDGQALALLGELAHVVADLWSCRRRRACLQLYTENEAWELGLELDGHDVLMSVYRTGEQPEVAVYERRVDLGELRKGITDAVAEVVSGR